MLILSYLLLSASLPPLLESLPQAHSAKTMHNARTIDRNLFISFSPLFVIFPNLSRQCLLFTQIPFAMETMFSTVMPFISSSLSYGAD